MNFKQALAAHRHRGFTVIELIVVISIVGVLATVSVIGYGAWKKSVIAAQVKSDLNGVASAMENSKNFSTAYPTCSPGAISACLSGTITPSTNVALTVQSASSTQYCVDGTSSDDSTVKFYLASEIKDQGAQTGTCALNRAGTTTLSIPAGLAVSTINATQLALSWTASTGSPNNYVMQCATDAAFQLGAQSATVSSPTVTGTVTGLQAVTTHYCRIKATTTAGGDSGYSAAVKADTSTYQPPTALAVSTAANTSLTLTWTANVDANGYTLQCATDTGFTSGVQTISDPASPGTVTSLTPNTTYYCHANSTNTTGVPSAYGAYITTATTANFGTIAAATALTESSSTPTSGTFSWTGITCSLGSPQYRLTWVSPQTTSTAWSSATSATGVTYPQQTANIYKVQSKCTYSGLDSSITDSSNKNFTSTGTADPVGAFGTIGWNGRFQFDTNANTYACTSPATEQYQLVSTAINGVSNTVSYGWTGTTVMNITGVNQGSQMVTYIQVRCLYNSIPSNVAATSSRTDAASIDAPGSVPGWCAGTCGSPRGDRWSAVGCPTGTTASYWSYAYGDYSNPIWGAYEAAGFFGYDRGYYNTGNTMVNDFLMARCTTSYAASAYGPQSSARY